MKKAALVISHGSRSSKTKEEVIELVNQLKGKTDFSILEYAFLEIETPSIPEGIDLCVEKGATIIIVLLNFLNSGRHVDEDIPNIIQQSRQKHKNVSIKISRPVGQHPGILNLFTDLLKST
ncbi:MAG: CbiX/SirB N-terminal domain-containing protein [Candidatus Omnitrophica bacterium]|nr:CbiX/SirB N-terminal domain-containing protein [Candidatus Omnitrophota bacterium]